MKETILLAIFLLGMVSPVISQNGSTNTNSFEDERNELFSCDFPIGWNSTLYDDTRTKVKFYDKNDPKLYARVIAKKSINNFTEVWAEAKNTIRNMEAKGVNCSLDTTFISDSIPVAHVSSDLTKFGAGYTELFLFISSGVHFNIQVCADSRNEMERAKTNFDLIMNSITISKKE